MHRCRDLVKHVPAMWTLVRVEGIERANVRAGTRLRPMIPFAASAGFASPAPRP